MLIIEGIEGWSVQIRGTCDSLLVVLQHIHFIHTTLLECKLFNKKRQWNKCMNELNELCEPTVSPVDN